MIKKTLFTLSIMACACLFFTSCGDDEESMNEECATCTVTQVITADGVEIGRQTLSLDQEVCGEALDATRAQESTVTQELAGMTQTIVTSVDCR